MTRAFVLLAMLLAAGPLRAAEDSPDADRPLPIPSFRDMMILTDPMGGKPAGPADTPAEQPRPAAKAPEPPDDPNADVAFGAFQRGLYKKAFAEATKRAAAKPPSAPAMTLLGELYANGYGVARRPEEAVKWYERAVDAGDPRAMTALALAKLDGQGIRKDEIGALDLLDRASDLNEPIALYNLAVLELQRASRGEDAVRAARRMKRAAEFGEAAAQYAYAVLLKEGRGVEKDVSASAEWMRRAAEQDDVSALVEYGIAVFNGSGTVKNEAEGARLFRRAAERGNAIGQNRLARLYAHGRGVERDPAKAAAWHRLSSAQGLKDPWLEGYVGTMTREDREAADRLLARWTETFGPIPRQAEATAAKPAKP